MAEDKKKKFTFRGKTLEELDKMDIREFAKYLKSRQKRTVLRNFDKIEMFIKRCMKKNKKEKVIKTHKREMIIVPPMIGLTILVYNGQNFSPVRISPDMLGHRLGEFAQTRKNVTHGTPGVGATRGSAALSVK